MAINTTHPVLLAANQSLEQLKALRRRIMTADLEELDFNVVNELTAHRTKLIQLKNQVQEIYNRFQQKATLSKEEGQIKKKLDSAKKVCDDTENELFTAKYPSLLTRIEQLTEYDLSESRPIRAELLKFSSYQLTSDNQKLRVQLNSMLRAPSQKTQEEELNSPTPNSAIIKEQDVEFNEGLIFDQLKDKVNKTCASQDFQLTLDVYKELMFYSFNNYSFPDAAGKIAALFSKVEACLECIIQQKSDLENQSSQAEHPFIRLQALVKEIITDQKDGRKIQPTLNELSEEEKKQLLSELNANMHEELPQLTINSPFSTWGGSGATWEKKKQALDQIVSALPKPTANGDNSTQMRSQFQEIKAMKRPATFLHVLDLPQALQNIENQEADSKSRNIPLLVQQILPKLIELLPLLKGDSTDQLKNAKEKLELIMKNSELKCNFKQPDQESLIISRIGLHLWSLHKKEAPHLLQKNPNFYAFEAFIEPNVKQDPYYLRAVQRTIIEIALCGLEEAIHLNHRDCFKQCLQTLEQNGLNANDCIKEYPFVADDLFQKFYPLQQQAHQDNPSLVHPGAIELASHFGRIHFQLGKNGIDTHAMLQAINQVRAELLAVWGLKKTKQT
jgi:hypothetical protein